jgi:hypothetical protein
MQEMGTPEKERMRVMGAARKEWDLLVDDGIKEIRHDMLAVGVIHRFDVALRPSDYQLAPDSEKDVMPPPTSAQLDDFPGVSFFMPIDSLSDAAHAFIGKKGDRCYFMAHNAALPEGLGCCQDVMLRWKPEKRLSGLYPLSFRSMTSSQQGKKHVHGLHFSMYPTQRLLLAKFEDLVRNQLKPLSQPCDKHGGGERDDAALWPDTEEGVQPTRAPSSQRMRLACEALLSFWRSPDTPPNDAELAYLLLHDIGARNSPPSRFDANSTCTRLLYRALCAYDTGECVISNAGGYHHELLQALEGVLPERLHCRDDEDDADAALFHVRRCPALLGKNE